MLNDINHSVIDRLYDGEDDKEVKKEAFEEVNTLFTATEYE